MGILMCHWENSVRSASVKFLRSKTYLKISGSSTWSLVSDLNTIMWDGIPAICPGLMNRGSPGNALVKVVKEPQPIEHAGASTNVCRNILLSSPLIPPFSRSQGRFLLILLVWQRLCQKWTSYRLKGDCVYAKISQGSNGKNELTALQPNHSSHLRPVIWSSHWGGNWKKGKGQQWGAQGKNRWNKPSQGDRCPFLSFWSLSTPPLTFSGSLSLTLDWWNCRWFIPNVSGGRGGLLLRPCQSRVEPEGRRLCLSIKAPLPPPSAQSLLDHRLPEPGAIRGLSWR